MYSLYSTYDKYKITCSLLNIIRNCIYLQKIIPLYLNYYLTHFNVLTYKISDI